MRWKIALLAFLILNFAVNDVSSDKIKRNVDEEEPKGTIVANMARILSLRYDERAGRTFMMLNQKLVTKKPNEKKDVELIVLDEKKGVMTLAEKIDREQLCKRAEWCSIQIQAYTMPNEHFSMLDLELIINDINDNPPTFLERKIDLTLTEGEAKMDDIINLDKFRASDEDLGVNAKITYTMTDNPYFSIAQRTDEAGTPHLGLRVLIAPDHEMESLHSLAIFATDQGTEPLSDHVPLHITIADANDHDPVFDHKEYPINLEESIDTSSIIATVYASDRDSGDFGRVKYFLAPSSTAASEGLVSVDPQSGEVRLLKKLSKAIHHGLKIMIEARDSDPVKPRIGKAWLRLDVKDVNDNKPVINVNFIAESRNGTGYVPESAGVKTYIAYVEATDEDEGSNGEVKVRITTFAKKTHERTLHEVHDQFVLSPGGLISTGGQLDREIFQQYVIKIKACDGGSPQKCATENTSVIVLDANDNSPIFSTPSKTVVIEEDSNVGTVVTSVTASDADSSFPPSLWVKNKKIESSQNGVIAYSISGGDTNYFKIGRNSGHIHLKRSLDHETKNLWKLVVTARDGGFPTPRSANCTVIVRVGDINDNRPVFTNPTQNDTQVYATILYDQPIMIAKAADRDNGRNSKVLYKITEEDGVRAGDSVAPEGLFIINPVSGSLRLNFSKSNLTNFLGWHTIIIRASDSAESPLSVITTLHIKVTDEPLPDPLAAAGFDTKFIVIVAVLSMASLVLLALISVTLMRRRKKKQLQTYNCKTGKGKGRIWMRFPRREKEDQDFHNAKPLNQRHDSTLMDRYVEEFSHGQTTKVSNTSISLPVVRSMDMDSGRGDSGSDNDDFGNIDSGARSQHFHPFPNTRSLSNSQDDANSSRTSELGPRCEESCREFGHSDSCWLPSPSRDSYRPPSLASNHSLRYAVSSSDSRLPFHYNCIDVDDRRVADFLADRPGDRYSMAPTEYFQTLPAKTSDLYYHGYGNELETIDEGVPLGVPFAGGPDTYDVDDVSSLTNIRLTTSSTPSVLSPSFQSSRPGLFYIGSSADGRFGNTNWEHYKYRTIPCLQRASFSNCHQDLSCDESSSVRLGSIFNPLAPSSGLGYHSRSSTPSSGTFRLQPIVRPRDTPLVNVQPLSGMQNASIPQVHLQDLSSNERTIANEDSMSQSELQQVGTNELMRNSTAPVIVFDLTDSSSV